MKKSSKVIQEQVTDIKGTIVGFIEPEQEEKTQEQEIQEFTLQKQSEKELLKLSNEEQKAKRKKYAEEEERLEKVKAELLQSIRIRIPEIEKRFRIIDPKHRKIEKTIKSQSLNGKDISKDLEEKDLQKVKEDGERER